MDKSTEGVVLKDGQIKETLSNALAQLDISSAVNGREIEARSQFVQHLKKAIGDLTNPQMPIGIKPTLQRLIQESDYYIEHGNENAFVRLCIDAIEVCRQGWSVLSYWMSTSQNICYAIHWSLRDALDKHKKEMLKVTTQQNHSSKNDAVASCSNNPNAARKQDDNSVPTKYTFPLFNTTLRMLMQCGQEQRKNEASLVLVNQDPFASCQELYKNKF
jgi:hypothetical protein